MKNKSIVIIMVIVIVVLAAILGVMILQPTKTKDATKLKITSNKTLYEGEDLTIQLTDLNKTALSQQKIKITIMNEKGKIILNKTVKTNSKGNAKLDLDLKKGKYKVGVRYNGNENYTGNTTTQKLTIKEVKNTKNYPKYNSDLGYYRSTGITQDEMSVVELSNGHYVIIAGDGYYEYNGQNNQGKIISGSFLGHGGQKIY